MTALARKLALLLACISLFSACSIQTKPQAVSKSSLSYNEAIATSKSEQLLLNLVRLRYRDTIVFMDIDGVTVQNRTSASLGNETLFPFDAAGKGSALLVPELERTVTPTIVYKPLNSSQFAKDLLSPIAPETILLLANSGWSIERLLTCCVERLGSLSNAPSASGPTPKALPDNKAFRAVAENLRALQIDERLRVEFELNDDASSPEVILIINATERAECQNLETLLKVTGCDIRFRLVAKRSDLKTGEYFAQTRTVLAALYTLSHGVDVPIEHLKAGLATRSQPTSSDTQDWLQFLGGRFHIRVGQEPPTNASTKVFYRDHWYWISDSDLESKTTFSLILFLISLQSAASEGTAPLLTLNASG